MGLAGRSRLVPRTAGALGKRQLSDLSTTPSRRFGEPDGAEGKKRSFATRIRAASRRPRRRRAGRRRALQADRQAGAEYTSAASQEAASEAEGQMMAETVENESEDIAISGHLKISADGRVRGHVFIGSAASARAWQDQTRQTQLFAASSEPAVAPQLVKPRP